jgi:hypothetical protein
MKLEQANKKAAVLLAKLDNTEENLGFLKSIPFWCGHYLDPKDKTRIIQDTEKCCYNHWLGLPKRWNQRHPLYQYEIDFVSFLSRYRKLFAEKAAGLGITELVLRWLEHQALTNPEFDSAQIELVSGPNKVLAKELISRMVGLKEDNQDFHDLGSRGIARGITDYSFRIGTTLFEAVPSDNIDAIRGKPNCKVVFVDEAAFFLMQAKNEIQIRQAAEHMT